MKLRKVLLPRGLLRWVCWIFSYSPSFSMPIVFFFCYLRFWCAHLIIANIVCTWVLLIFLACSICSLLLFQLLFFLALFEPNEALFHLALFGDLFVVFLIFQFGCLPPTNLSPLERNVKCSFHRFIFVSFLHALFSCHSPMFSVGFSGA